MAETPRPILPSLRAKKGLVVEKAEVWTKAGRRKESGKLVGRDDVVISELLRMVLHVQCGTAMVMVVVERS